MEGSLSTVRLGVLDIGSNTVHLLIVDAYHGAAPVATASHKLELRLAEHVDADGSIDRPGVDALIVFVREACEFAKEEGAETLLAFATSAMRDAPNGQAVLKKVQQASGVEVAVLSGDDEARTTFLAVRRWFGWSSGELFVADIGGGSLELALGADEEPAVGLSLPLGAGRLTRQFGKDGDLDLKGLQAMKRFVEDEVGTVVDEFAEQELVRHFVATSKSFRQLARINGAPPSSEGHHITRLLKRSGLDGMAERLVDMSMDERAKLPGVSRGRVQQLPAAAVVAEGVMNAFGIDAFELCPWALREGMILEYLDAMPVQHHRV